MEQQYTLQNPNNRIPTINLILLGVITFGVYNHIYLWRITPMLEQHLQKKLTSQKILFPLTICFGLYLLLFHMSMAIALSFLGEFDVVSATAIFLFSDLIANLLLIATFVMYVIWGVRTFHVLNEYIQEKGYPIQTNKLWAYGLSIFYINYLINNIFIHQNLQFKQEGN